MTISKSQYQDPNYIPQDLFELDEQEQADEEERQSRKKAKVLRQESLIEEAGYDLYLYYRETHGLSHARAALAADYHPETVKMPAPKKTTSKAGTKVTKTVYPKKGGTTKSTTTTDINKLVKAATERALSKNIETQHSFARIAMAGLVKAYTTSGTAMSMLNTTVTDGFSNNAIMSFNLSSMIQVRGSTTSGAASGWRVGNKVNVESISVDVRGAINNPNVDCKYHVWVCRKKDGITAGFNTPSITNFSDTGLWRKKTGGPFSVDTFNVAFPTSDRKNTESWSWPEGMHDSKTVVQVPDANGVRTVQMGFYKKIGHVWEFNTDQPSATPALKDGDYVLFVFREGIDEALKPSTLDTLQVHIDIAFKDA